MEIATGCSMKPIESEAVDEACTQLITSIGTPSFIFVLSTVTYNTEIIMHELNIRFGATTKIMGGTTCIGVITERGYCSEHNRALGLFGIRDDANCYGIAGLSLTGNPRQDGQTVIRNALKNAERPGELPTMILMSSAPGHEEALIEGIMDEIGKKVPIFGGSSADNSIAGLWQQFCGEAIYQDGIAVAAIYSSQPIGYAFHNGYIPTQCVGTVTKSSGRIVHTINYQPAAEIYNQWTENSLSDVLGTNSNIVSLSSFHPFGREVGKIGSIPYYNLSHPKEIFEDGSMSFFSDMNEGEVVNLMTGTKHSLKYRIKRVIHLAKGNYAQGNGKKPKGVLIIYCAGCFLVIQDEIQDVVNAIRTELPSEPFLGMFSFGEQGCLFGGENRHGNLMISSIVFG